MNSIRSWTITVCIVVIICTMIEFLFPPGKMEKVFKTVLGIFVLCALLIPIKDALKKFDFNVEENKNLTTNKSNLKESVKNQTESMAKENIKSLIKKLLKEKNIVPEKINVNMDTNQENCISIKKVEIFLSRGDKNKKDVIKKELEKKLDLKIEVAVGSE